MIGPTSRFDRTKPKTERARRLRRDTTPSERKLWTCLRSAEVDGISFRRQHPVGPYILDFYAPSVALAIEVDGGQHGTESGALGDRERDAWLNDRGITVLCVWNSDVTENLEGVVETIRHAVRECRGRATRSPPLEKGRPGGDRRP